MKALSCILYVCSKIVACLPRQNSANLVTLNILRANLRTMSGENTKEVSLIADLPFANTNSNKLKAHTARERNEASCLNEQNVRFGTALFLRIGLHFAIRNYIM